MTLSALPSTYDLSTPESNLAGDCGCGRGLSCADCVALDGLADATSATSASTLYADISNAAVRFSAALLAGAHGYRRGGALHGLLWAIAGNWLPLPTAAVAVYQTASAEQRGAAMQWGRTLPQRLRSARARARA